MPLNWPSSGVNLHGAFGLSGLPYVTSSNAAGVVKHELPYVSRWFVVQNLDGSTDIAFGFTGTGVTGSNKYTVQANEVSPVFEMQASDIFVSGSGAGQDYELIVGMTGIPRRNAEPLTGSLADNV